jgi:hypothetical protein
MKQCLVYNLMEKHLLKTQSKRGNIEMNLDKHAVKV